MIELGELERHQQDFARRNVRIVAVSVEGTTDAVKTQAQYPHLTVVADEGHGLSDAVEVIHANSNPSGGDTSAPTTILIDTEGREVGRLIGPAKWDSPEARRLIEAQFKQG